MRTPCRSRAGKQPSGSYGRHALSPVGMEYYASQAAYSRSGQDAYELCDGAISRIKSKGPPAEEHLHDALGPSRPRCCAPYPLYSLKTVNVALGYRSYHCTSSPGDFPNEGNLSNMVTFEYSGHGAVPTPRKPPGAGKSCCRHSCMSYRLSPLREGPLADQIGIGKPGPTAPRRDLSGLRNSPIRKANVASSSPARV